MERAARTCNPACRSLVAQECEGEQVAKLRARSKMCGLRGGAGGCDGTDQLNSQDGEMDTRRLLLDEIDETMPRRTLAEVADGPEVDAVAKAGFSDEQVLMANASDQQGREAQRPGERQDDPSAAQESAKSDAGKDVPLPSSPASTKAVLDAETGRKPFGSRSTHSVPRTPALEPSLQQDSWAYCHEKVSCFLLAHAQHLAFLQRRFW